MAEAAERLRGDLVGARGGVGRAGSESDFPAEAEIVCTSRDDRDVTTIRVVGLVALVSVVINFFLGFGVVALLFTLPYVQFVNVGPDGQVRGVDVRRLGETAEPGVLPDAYALKMKLRFARDFAAAKYTINMKTREEDNARFLMMMLKRTREEYWEAQKRKQAPQIEKAEQHQGIWEEQDVQIDEAKDPLLVRIIGTQKLIRTVNEVPSEEKHQYTLEVRLIEDKEGPQPRNNNTGYLVSFIAEKEL